MYRTRDTLLDICSFVDHIRNQSCALKSLLETLTRDLYILHRDCTEKARSPIYRRQKAIIVRVLIKYLTQGMTREEAIYKTALELNETQENVLFAYSDYKPAQKATETTYKYWLVLRLRKLKYPISDISKITGYSEKYIFQLEKKLKKEKLVEPTY